MEDSQESGEPTAEAFEDGYSEADQATIDSLQNRHRARVLVPLLIVIVVALFLGWLGPVGPESGKTMDEPNQVEGP